MKRNNFYLLIAFLFLGLYFASCNFLQKSKTADNLSEVEWSGTYSGTLPCASCPGIHYVLQLNNDLTFHMNTIYLEREGAVFNKGGSFSWNDKGDILTLDLGEDKDNSPAMYLFEGGKLIQLDMEGNKITGELADKYILNKVSDLEEKYWKLIEINGKELDYEEDWVREPHIRFWSEEQRVNGSTGCNSFFGSYIVKDNEQLEFSTMGATKMACREMWVEDELFLILDGILDFKVKEDSLILLKNGQIAARFEAVWFY